MNCRLPYLVILITLLLAFPARAQDSSGAIGSFMEVEGSASITHIGQKTAAAVDAPVYLGDIIETATDSKASIVFVDDTDITLGENARMTIDEYVFDEDAAAGNKGRYSFLRGAFLFTSGLINKTANPDLVLETPYGSIGLRGTTVWGGEIDNEYGVLVQEGEVTVTTNRGRIRVPAGQGTNIRNRDSIPTFAAAWGQEKIEHAKGKVAFKRRDLVQQRIATRKQQNVDLRGKRRELRQQRPDGPKNIPAEQKQGQNDELKKRIDENRDRIQERREQYRDKMKDAPRDDGTAKSQEQRENFHLQRNPDANRPALNRRR